MEKTFVLNSKGVLILANSMVSEAAKLASINFDNVSNVLTVANSLKNAWQNPLYLAFSEFLKDIPLNAEDYVKQTLVELGFAEFAEVKSANKQALNKRNAKNFSDFNLYSALKQSVKTLSTTEKDSVSVAESNMVKFVTYLDNLEDMFRISKMDDDADLKAKSTSEVLSALVLKLIEFGSADSDKIKAINQPDSLFGTNTWFVTLASYILLNVIESNGSILTSPAVDDLLHMRKATKAIANASDIRNLVHAKATIFAIKLEDKKRKSKKDTAMLTEFNNFVQNRLAEKNTHLGLTPYTLAPKFVEKVLISSSQETFFKDLETLKSQAQSNGWNLVLNIITSLSSVVDHAN